MNRLLTIQKTLAAFLLLILALSVMPRIYFHDLVATHTDSSGCSMKHSGTVIHSQGFHCHFDDLVVSSPFLPESAGPLNPVSLYRESFLAEKCQSVLSLYSFCKEGRGPPIA